VLGLIGCLAACADDARVIRVGVVQTEGVPGSLAENTDHAEKLVREAAAKGARYILLPELYAFFPAARAQAGKEAVEREAAEGGEAFQQRMLALAAELDVNIAFGMPEARDGRLYNALVFVEPGGVVGSYAKRWLLDIGREGAREVDVFAEGTKPVAFEWGGVRAGPMICSDGGGQGNWHALLFDRAQIVIWASSGVRMDRLRAGSPHERGLTNGLPIAFANRSRAGVLGNRLAGGSQIVDGEGVVLAAAGQEADVILVADVVLRARNAPIPDVRKTLRTPAVAPRPTTASTQPAP